MLSDAAPTPEEPRPTSDRSVLDTNDRDTWGAAAEEHATSFDTEDQAEPLTGAWRRESSVRPLTELYATVPVPDPSAARWRTALCFFGPERAFNFGWLYRGTLATGLGADIAGGAQLGYNLIFVYNGQVVKSYSSIMSLA